MSNFCSNDSNNNQGNVTTSSNDNNRTNEEHLDDVTVLPPAPALPAISVRTNNEDIMAILEANVDPILEERMRQKAMQFALVGAIENENTEKIQLLVQNGVNIDAQIMYTKTPLTHAIEQKCDKVAIQLLENGCSPVLTVDHFPYSLPIHLAAREGLLNVIEKLIEMGIDINIRDHDKMTPLHIASYHDRADVVDILIANGADSNAQDSCYRTPLHRAVENGSISVINKLLKYGIDLNTTDKKGWTALHLAIALDYQDIANMLMHNECKLDIEDVNGRTPLSIACDFLCRPNYDIIRATQFHYDARKRDFMQGRYLNLLQRPRENREMLSIVVDLINAGANIDSQGCLPIDVATIADHADTVYMLINAGALIPHVGVHGFHMLQPLPADVRLGIKISQLLDWMRERYILQFTLLWQCKRKIRKMLALTCKNLENGIDTLPLPSQMKTLLK